MSNYLLEYKKIIDKFVKREMSAKKFRVAFSKLFYDESLNPINHREFGIINELWGWLDLYEPKQYLRKGNTDYLNETQLRKKVKEFQKKINDLLSGKNTSKRRREKSRIIYSKNKIQLRGLKAMIAFTLWTIEELYKTNKLLFILYLTSFFAAGALLFSLFYKLRLLSLVLFSYWAVVMISIANRKKTVKK